MRLDRCEAEEGTAEAQPSSAFSPTGVAMHPHVVAVEPKPSFVVALTFADGSHGSVDLSRWIAPSQGVWIATKAAAWLTVA